MAEIVKVSKFTVTTRTESDGYTVSVFADSKLVQEQPYGFSVPVAEGEKSTLFSAENFGVYDNTGNIKYVLSNDTTPDPVSTTDTKYVYDEIRQGPRIGIKVYKTEAGTENLIYTGELASGSTTTYDQLKQEAINALQATDPGAVNMTKRGSAPPPPAGSGNSAMLDDDAQTKITGVIKEKIEVDKGTHYSTILTLQARAEKGGKTYIAENYTFTINDTEATQKETWSKLYSVIADEVYYGDIDREENSTSTTLTAAPAENTSTPTTTTPPTATATEATTSRRDATESAEDSLLGISSSNTIKATGTAAGADKEFVLISSRNKAQAELANKAREKGGTVKNIKVIRQGEPVLTNVAPAQYEATTTVSGEFVEDPPKNPAPVQNTAQSTSGGGETITAQGDGRSPDLSFARELALTRAQTELSKLAKGRKVTNIEEISSLEEILYNADKTYNVKRTLRGITSGEIPPGIEDRFPDGYKVINVTFQFTQVDPDRPKPQEPTPPPPPPVQKDENLQQPRYLPEFSYTDPQVTTGGELVVVETQQFYSGSYIRTANNKYYAGRTPEDNGVELEELQEVTNRSSPGLVQIPLGVVPQILKGFFKFTLKKGDKRKGVTQRFFIQPRTTGRISEVDLEGYVLGQQELVNCNFATVDWNIQGPAEDKLINGYPYEGAASKNKKAIQALEKQMPGISNFITNYAELVEEPVSRKDLALEKKVVVQEDPLDQLENSRKANFDTRL